MGAAQLSHHLPAAAALPPAWAVLPLDAASKRLQGWLLLLELHGWLYSPSLGCCAPAGASLAHPQAGCAPNCGQTRSSVPPGTKEQQRYTKNVPNTENQPFKIGQHSGATASPTPPLEPHSHSKVCLNCCTSLGSISLLHSAQLMGS